MAKSPDSGAKKDLSIGAITNGRYEKLTFARLSPLKTLSRAWMSDVPMAGPNNTAQKIALSNLRVRKNVKPTAISIPSPVRATGDICSNCYTTTTGAFSTASSNSLVPYLRIRCLQSSLCVCR